MKWIHAGHLQAELAALEQERPAKVRSFYLTVGARIEKTIRELTLIYDGVDKLRLELETKV